MLPFVTKESIAEGFKLLTSQKAEFVGIKNKDSLIGFIQFKITTNLENYRQLVLDELVVSSPYRGRGCSKAILKYVESYTKDNMCKVLFLATSKNNSIAQKLYYTSGYELSGLYMRKKI